MKDMHKLAHLEPGCPNAKDSGCTCPYMPEQRYTKGIQSGCPLHDCDSIVIWGAQPWANVNPRVYGGE